MLWKNENWGQFFQSNIPLTTHHRCPSWLKIWITKKLTTPRSHVRFHNTEVSGLPYSVNTSVLAILRISRGVRKLTRTPDYKKTLKDEIYYCKSYLYLLWRIQHITRTYTRRLDKTPTMHRTLIFIK